MISTTRRYKQIYPPVWWGYLSCGLPASFAMSGLTVSNHLAYPNIIPQYILFEILTEARPGRSAMSAVTVSLHLVYPSGIPQYILFEICTEAKVG